MKFDGRPRMKKRASPRALQFCRSRHNSSPGFVAPGLLWELWVGVAFGVTEVEPQSPKCDKLILQ